MNRINRMYDEAVKRYLCSIFECIEDYDEAGRYEAMWFSIMTAVRHPGKSGMNRKYVKV